MATTTSPKTNPFDVDFEAAAERIRGLNEKVLDGGEADRDHIGRHI